MFQMSFTLFDETPKVRKAVDRYKVENIGHAAGLVRTTARRSIRKRKGPSAAGTPPHTHTGLMRRSIVYAVHKHRDEAIIGPTASMVGRVVGGLHEFGGVAKTGEYPARPYMGPAFEKILPRLPQKWRNSLKV